MNEGSEARRSTIIPELRYAEPGAAVEWLCRAFGFERRAVYRGKGGMIDHAELSYGNSMIMVGQARDDEYGSVLVTPGAVGGLSTQVPYVVTPNVVDHHARAKEAGAQVVIPLGIRGGGWMYSCRDPELHLWTFSEYDPWAPPES